MQQDLARNFSVLIFKLPLELAPSFICFQSKDFLKNSLSYQTEFVEVLIGF